MCDRDSDCEDNSDEENCEALECKLSHHVCASNDSICLPPEKLCDGNDDCPDGSDEKLCSNARALKHKYTQVKGIINIVMFYSTSCHFRHVKFFFCASHKNYI